MQFPVPQFTDVEDKIIGPLTVKQFGIIFATGILVFIGYSVTKSVPVLVVFCLLFGLPGLAIAFGKVNGRPMYTSFGYVVKFIASPKVLVFHKEMSSFSASRFKNAEVATEAAVKAPEKVEDTQTRLKEVYKLLQQQSAEEQRLIKQIH